jgi:hypothetical protein
MMIWSAYVQRMVIMGTIELVSSERKQNRTHVSQRYFTDFHLHYVRDHERLWERASTDQVGRFLGSSQTTDWAIAARLTILPPSPTILPSKYLGLFWNQG